TQDFQGVTGSLKIGQTRDPHKNVPVVHLLQGGGDLAALVELPEPVRATSGAPPRGEPEAPASRPPSARPRRVAKVRQQRAAPGESQWPTPAWENVRAWAGTVPILDAELSAERKEHALTRRAVELIQ